MSIPDQLARELQKTELESPMWAVVDFQKVIGRDLTYGQAYRLMDENRHISGICIVTNNVADKRCPQ